MDISLDFARTLIEGDQLARSGRHEQAQVVYLSLGRLPGLDDTERALAQARLARLQAVLTASEGEGVEVVHREAPIEPPSDEARAEVLANQGDLAGAADLYQQIVDRSPDNALALERLAELRRALAPAPAPTTTAAPATALSLDEFDLEPPASDDALARELDLEPPADDEQPLDLVLDDAVESAASAVQQAVAAVVDWRQALPEDPVAMLELLLARVRANRPRPVAH